MIVSKSQAERILGRPLKSLGDIKARDKGKRSYYVLSESGKNMGGPYDRSGAKDRLRQVEAFKHMRPNPEFRSDVDDDDEEVIHQVLSEAPEAFDAFDFSMWTAGIADESAGKGYSPAAPFTMYEDPSSNAVRIAWPYTGVLFEFDDDNVLDFAQRIAELEPSDDDQIPVGGAGGRRQSSAIDLPDGSMTMSMRLRDGVVAAIGAVSDDGLEADRMYLRLIHPDGGYVTGELVRGDRIDRMYPVGIRYLKRAKLVPFTLDHGSMIKPNAGIIRAGVKWMVDPSDYVRTMALTRNRIPVRLIPEGNWSNLIDFDQLTPEPDAAYPLKYTLPFAINYSKAQLRIYHGDLIDGDQGTTGFRIGFAKGKKRNIDFADFGISIPYDVKSQAEMFLAGGVGGPDINPRRRRRSQIDELRRLMRH